MGDLNKPAEEKICCADCDKGETCKLPYACTGACDTSPVCVWFDGGCAYYNRKT
jgi:hypothetical protein